MNMLRFILLAFFLFVSSPARLDAYTLPPDWVLTYATKNRPVFEAIEMKQTVDFLDPRFPGGRMSMEETWYYQPSGEMRVDGKVADFSQTWIEKGGLSLVVTNGNVSDEGRVHSTLLRDLFLANTPEVIKGDLITAGINANLVSLGRYERELVYIIGAKEGDLARPQLWIAKDSFLPLRLVFFEGEDGRAKRWEYRFSNFGKGSPSWYPGLSEVYIEQERVAEIRVREASFRKTFPAQHFDIEAMRKKYPHSRPQKRDSLGASQRLAENLDRLRKQY